MKKYPYLLSAILFLFVLCSCQQEGEQSAPYQVYYEGISYTIDPVLQTISFRDVTCQFSTQKFSNGTRLDITYPDGSTYWWKSESTGGYCGWSDDYDPQRYMSGDILATVLGADKPPMQKASNTHPLWGLLLLVLGIFHAFAPHAAWTVGHGWRYRNAQPSDLALGVNRAGGVIAMIIGIFCFFF